MNNFEQDLNHLKELVNNKADRNSIVSFANTMFNKILLLQNIEYKKQCSKQVQAVISSII